MWHSASQIAPLPDDPHLAPVVPLAELEEAKLKVEVKHTDADTCIMHVMYNSGLQTAKNKKAERVMMVVCRQLPIKLILMLEL